MGLTPTGGVVSGEVLSSRDILVTCPNNRWTYQYNRHHDFERKRTRGYTLTHGTYCHVLNNLDDFVPRRGLAVVRGVHDMHITVPTGKRMIIHLCYVAPTRQQKLDHPDIEQICSETPSLSSGIRCSVRGGIK